MSLDVLRGVAILGILLLNIRSFSMVSGGYIYPLATGTGFGLAADGDRLLFSLTTVFGQVKFMTLFATLYGAGLLFASTRAAKPWPWLLRRSAVLAVVGLLHMTLVWHGDILFIYALLGLIAFSMRGWSPRVLVSLAVAGQFASVLLLSLMFGCAGFAFTADPSLGHVDDLVLQPQDARLDEAQAFRGGYSDQLGSRFRLALLSQPIILVLTGPSLVGLMLLGMALVKTGFFAGVWREKSYRLTMLLGSLGFVATAAVPIASELADWPVFASGVGNLIGTTLFSLPAALAIAAVVVRGVGLFRWLAPVGRMAFTNYLTQSIICTFVFYGGWGLGYFQKLGYAEQLLIVAAVWVLQILWSHLWLQKFRQGPLEWLWRYATYGTRPAMRR